MDGKLTDLVLAALEAANSQGHAQVFEVSGLPTELEEVNAEANRCKGLLLGEVEKLQDSQRDMEMLCKLVEHGLQSLILLMHSWNTLPSKSRQEIIQAAKDAEAETQKAVESFLASTNELKK